MNRKIFIIDPQSVNSLAAYDRCMIEGIRDFELLFFGNADYNDRPLNDNVRFFPVFKYTRHSNPIAKGLSYIRSLISIAFHGLKERPAAFHLQWIRLWGIDRLFIRFFKKTLKSRFVFTVHNILPRKQGPETFSRFSRLYEFADLLIAHTDTTKKELIEKFGLPADKITVMPHGVLEMKVTEADLENSRQRLESRHCFADKVVFSSLGVQSPYKGTDLLLEAWINNKELSDNERIVLLIAGKPSGISFPQDLPGNVIIIPELLSNPDFKYLLLRTDVMVLPYREIDQSGVLLSLIQESKPYCSTEVGELTRPFDIADVGWKIPEVTSEAIAATILKIASEPEGISRRKTDREAWRRLGEAYSWQNSNRILDEAYNNLLNRDV